MKPKSILLISVLLTVLLSGCFQVEFDQTLKRNGKMDMSLTISSNMPMILNELKGEMEIDDPKLQKRYSYSETRNSFTHSFKNLDPTKDTFFSGEGDMEDQAFLDPQNYAITREFKFPFYYFTYEIDMTEEETQQNDDFSDQLENMLSNAFQIKYNIQVFGKITDTNANQIDSKRVEIDMMSNTDTVYYVTFRDFFLWTWIGSLF